MRNRSSTNKKSSKQVQPLPNCPPKIATESQPTFASTMLQGFGFGIGTSVARNVVDRAFDSSSNIPNISNAEKPKQDCILMWENYNTCLRNSDEQSCNHFYKDFFQCIKNDVK